MSSVGARPPPGLSPPCGHRIKNPKFISAARTARPRAVTSRLGGDGTTPGEGRRWDAVFKDVVRTAARRWDEYVRSVVRGAGTVDENPPRVGAGAGKEWDWERWKRHFLEMDEQASVVSILKSDLAEAVGKEEYEDAAKLKIAIAAATENDAVGRAMSLLQKALEEERYQDAAFIRDHAGTGLVGWWAGTSDDPADPYGRIVRITADHGKYVARSFSSRQLANGRSGFPLFEIYVAMNEDGEYKLQATYLKRKGGLPDKFPTKVTTSGISLNPSTETVDDFSLEDDEISEDNDNEDGDEGNPGIHNILDDMVPGVKVKVMKVVSPGKVDRDLISQVIEQIIDEEDEEADSDIEVVESDNELKSGSDVDEIDLEGDVTGIEGLEESEGEMAEMSLKFVIGGRMPRPPPGSMPPNELVRVPALMERRGRRSFVFSVKSDDVPKESSGMSSSSFELTRSLKRSPDLIIADLAKALVNREKISLKMLKDLGELISLTVNQDRNYHIVNGSILFHRVDAASTSDPLRGLYVSAPGMLQTEVVQLRRKFGQWEGDGVGKAKAARLQFYEYVEALKLTGDPSLPAGQVAFRAKIGKRYQLPHKGIIPEEFGMIARYKGQGRLADPGFKNPRWVDGELVILDGKYIKGGPVIGFVYWAPEYHYLVFFNRLRLQS